MIVFLGIMDRMVLINKKSDSPYVFMLQGLVFLSRQYFNICQYWYI